MHDVSWTLYEQLLVNYQDRSNPRFTYDRGVLEIMSPSAEQEELSHMITLLVNVLAEEMSLDVRGFGSTTLRREDLDRGFEPDSCFYIQSVDRIAGVAKLDLAIHLPPDLVIEIDLTHPSLDKLPIYAAVGVPEVWRYHDGVVTLFKLESDKYVAASESVALPGVTSAVISRFVKKSKQQKRPLWLREVREWARAQRRTDNSSG